MSDIKVKTCTVCNAEKEINEFPVNRNVCTICRREAAKVKRREYYAKNREQELARKKIYDEANKDKVAAYQANYRSKSKAEKKREKEENATT